MTWEGVTWPRGQPWLWSIPIKAYHSMRFDERTMVLECWLYGHFWRNYEPKTKPRPLGKWPDPRGHRLTRNLKFVYQSLRLVTADMLVFFRKPPYQWAKWRGGCTPPVCRKQLRLARVKKKKREGALDIFPPSCARVKYVNVNKIKLTKQAVRIKAIKVIQVTTV